MRINNFAKILLTSSMIIVSALNPLNASWIAKKNKKAKIIRTYITSKIEDMDPATISCIYKAKMISQVYETLLTYDYTSSDPKLIPLLLKEMPQVSKDGRVYTFHLKPNIHFHRYPGSSKNEAEGPELTAKDVIYSLIRLFDPAVQCKNRTFLDSIKGSKAFYNARRNDPNTPYKIEGIQELAKYTFSITLDEPNAELLFGLAMPFTSIMSKLVAERYKRDLKFYAIGTAHGLCPENSILELLNIFLKRTQTITVCLIK